MVGNDGGALDWRPSLLDVMRRGLHADFRGAPALAQGVRAAHRAIAWSSKKASCGPWTISSPLKMI